MPGCTCCILEVNASHPAEQDAEQAVSFASRNKQRIAHVWTTRKRAPEKSRNAGWQWQPLSLLSGSDAIASDKSTLSSIPARMKLNRSLFSFYIRPCAMGQTSRDASTACRTRESSNMRPLHTLCWHQVTQGKTAARSVVAGSRNHLLQ